MKNNEKNKEQQIKQTNNKQLCCLKKGPAPLAGEPAGAPRAGGRPAGRARPERPGAS